MKNRVTLNDSQDVGRMMSEPKPGEEDYSLIEAALRVGSHLKFKVFPQRIRWVNRLLFRGFASDEVRFVGSLIVLPARMKGKLEPEEWTPLMASSLIYRRRLIWDMTTEALEAILLTPVLVIFGGAAVYRLFGPNLLAFFLFFTVGVVPFFQNRVSQGRKKSRLQADLEAATATLGKESFLKVLRKIDSLGMTDIEKVKKRRLSRYFSNKPTLTERIQTLIESEKLLRNSQS